MGDKSKLRGLRIPQNNLSPALQHSNTPQLFKFSSNNNSSKQVLKALLLSGNFCSRFRWPCRVSRVNSESAVISDPDSTSRYLRPRSVSSKERQYGFQSQCACTREWRKCFCPEREKQPLNNGLIFSYVYENTIGL